MDWSNVLPEIVSGTSATLLAGFITFIFKKLFWDKKHQLEDKRESSFSLNPFLISLFVTSFVIIITFFSFLYSWILYSPYLALASVGFALKSENGCIIKPIAPFNKDTQYVARNEFNDAKTGLKHKGIEYWKSIYNIISEYINHPESKFDGDNGKLTRKHIEINNIIFTGKESTNIESDILHKQDKTFTQTKKNSQKN